MKYAILILTLFGYAAALPVNNTELDDTLDWSKIRSEDVFVDTDGTVFYGPGGRIVGGTTVTRHEAPHQGGLMNDRNGFCGCSFISHIFALTAAHCTTGSKSATVIAGAHVINGNEATQQRIRSIQIIDHPNYNPSTLVNDISLVKLSQSLVLNAYVATIPIAPANTGDLAGVNALLTGWGRMSDASSGIATTLQKVNLNVITNTVCALTFGNLVTNSHICTSGQGGKGACNGDSGGPLVWQNYQIGIVSFGSASGCQKGLPSVYTRVSSYNNWIRQHAGL